MLPRQSNIISKLQIWYESVSKKCNKEQLKKTPTVDL